MSYACLRSVSVFTPVKQVIKVHGWALKSVF